MATIVNTTPSQTDSTGNGMGFLMGMILLLAVIFLFFFYGLPLLTQSFRSVSGPQIQVPGKIDVNVNNPQGK
jgi:hypothetical protein